MRTCTRAGLLAGVTLASAAVLAGQTFRAGVDLVRVDVSVTRGGQPVHGLTPADFSLSDSGVAQRINSVTLLEDLPVSVMLALDTSGSVEGERLRHLVDAGHGLLARLRPGDRAGLVTFADRADLRAPMSTERAPLTRALASLTGKGATAVHDAVWAAVLLSPIDDTRPLILVFSDGVDNASWLSRSAFVEGVRRAGVVIHAVELSGPVTLSPRGPRPLAPPPALDEAVVASGGRVWSATSSRDLQALFTKAIDEMRARYLVTFYPENVPRPGWHPLKIGARGRGDVIARPGYFKTPHD